MTDDSYINGNINNMPYGWISKSDVNLKICRLWKQMWNRVYHDRYYIGVTIYPKWKYLSNFVSWVEAQPNYKEFSENPFSYSIDKDILRKDNRVYCPKYCQLVLSKTNRKDSWYRNGRPNRKKKAIIGIPLDDSNPILVFDGCSDVDKYGFNVSGVYQCLKGSYKQHKSYKWYYITKSNL